MLPASVFGVDARSVEFDRDIRPLLAKNCFACHGNDEEDRQSDLRLDTEEGLFARRDELAVVEPHHPERSLLFARMTAEGDSRMPPAGSGRSLDATQIGLIRQWIEQGAEYRIHWAFAAPRRPELPQVTTQTWVLSPIDSFVLARLTAEGLAPSPEADRHTLIRRLSLDLIGLPPDVDEVDAFVNDPRPEAYEELIDRLLASPHYGERWARVWLDLARYADTQGYEKDLDRSIWPYRDWVIRALNDNMPYDQFTIEQLAGDLLDNPTQAQLVATGFHRNTMTNTEGGIDAEEFRVAAVKDRIATTMQVWMGLSFQCAECHNHKYDPITQREYYELFAVFNQTSDAQTLTDEPSITLKSWFGAPDLPKARTLVMRAVPDDKLRETHVMVRGNFLDKGDRVEPTLPAVFGPVPAGREPLDRLGVARCLVSNENPLTARVAVNRLWACLFGVGLVETEDDFGSQGTPPSHPELLDWLATEYIRLGWDTKALLKTIVSSATYRQSSDVDPQRVERDPRNVLLARGARFRLEAEAIRDHALTSSGLLSSKMYGPSVMPPQPDGIWKIIYNTRQWETSEGEDRYRRGLYTFWRRTSPYPSMILFDGVSREVCTSRRIRTNTPLQALVTLNDSAFVECAVALAARAISEAGPDADRVAQHAFRLCVARIPSTNEVERLVTLYRCGLERFAADASSARELVAHHSAVARQAPEEPIASIAAWSLVANVLLSLDETLTKR
jgi:hypothetical protein